MSDLNKFIFTGRLGADATVKKLPSGTSVMEVSAAINSGYGDYKETLWVKLQRFGERMNNVCPIFTKGSLVSGVGTIKLNRWTGTMDGEEHADIVVNCSELNLMQQKKADGAGPSPDVPDDEVVF